MSRARPILAYWKVEPYGCIIFAICGATDRTVKNYLTREGCEIEDDDMDQLGLDGDEVAITHTLDSAVYVIRFRDRKPHPATVAHEALHAAGRILRRAGIEHTEDTEEAYTYLMDNIVEKVWDAAN